MPEPFPFATVTAPLAHWAAERPEAVAADDGETRLSFRDLHETVARRAAAMTGPAVRWVEEGEGQLDRLVDFCAIVASGRAAAVADPTWPEAVRASVAEMLDSGTARPSAPTPETPFYVGFTSGTTALPKGFLRNHHSWVESFEACRRAFGTDVTGPVLAPGSLSHSLFLFAMLLGLWTGGGVHVQNRFSAGRALDLLAAGRATCLVAVPSQLLLMLEDAERHGRSPVHGLRLILISGARWMRRHTPRLARLFPKARIVEFYGASETSFIAWTDSNPALPDNAVGRPFDGVEVTIHDAEGRALPAGNPGYVFVRSPMLFDGYVTGDDGSLLRDGGFVSVKDIGYRDEAGLLHLLGRDRRMLVTSGRNLFPEEVETALAGHEAVADVSVCGVPDPLRGQRVAAVLSLRADAVGREALVAHLRGRLEDYKIPRLLLVRDGWPRTAGGKTDHALLAREAAAFVAGETMPWLRRLS